MANERITEDIVRNHFKNDPLFKSIVFVSKKNTDMELTKIQIERQDFVDNAIYNLLRELNPMDKFIQWDIEMIAAIRDIIQYYIIDKISCSKRDFYSCFEIDNFDKKQ